MILIRQLGGAFAGVGSLFLAITTWVVLSENGWSVYFVNDLLGFMGSAVTRLTNSEIAVPTTYLVISGLFLLTLGATLSAWMQVCSRSVIARYLGLLIFFPSFVPVYVYGVSLSGHDPSAQWIPIMLTAIVAGGNGVWWWWHRQFVHALEQIRSEKAGVGIANLGLSVEKYFIYPEFTRVIWTRLPEMLLWIIVNALFIEVALPEITGGILHDLALSLSDGRRTVDWVGVCSGVGYVAVIWLLVHGLGRVMLQRSPSYQAWGVIRPRSTPYTLDERISLAEWSLASIPWVFLAFLSVQALQSQSPYWELIVAMVVFGAMTFCGILFGCVRLSMPLVQPIERSSKKSWIGMGIFALIFVGSTAVVVEQGATVTWFVDAEIAQSEGESGGLFDSEDDGNTCESKNTSFSNAAVQLLGPAILFLLFVAFLVPALCVFLFLLLGFSAYFFSTHYRWNGVGVMWSTYRGISQLVEGLAKIPPYLLLVILMFWLGFQTYSAVTKQLVWICSLLVVLVPTQLLQVSSWIQEAADARFLVARRALGITALSTFGYLMLSRWRQGVVAIIAFSLGLALLMDMSMIWLLQDRGSFVWVPRSLVLDACAARNWVTVLDALNIQAWHKVVAWCSYPGLMWLLVYLPMRRGRGKSSPSPRLDGEAS